MGGDNRFSYLRKDHPFDNSKLFPFYGGTNPFSIHNHTHNPPKLRKKIDLHPTIRRPLDHHQQDEDSFEYLQKSFSLRKRRKEGGESGEKVGVGGFRTCYRGMGVKTIEYPTNPCAGIDLQRSLKSKQQTIRDIRQSELIYNRGYLQKLSSSNC